MFRLVSTVFPIVGLLAIAGCSTSTPDTSADLKAIAGVRDAYAAAFSAEDADKTAAVFATDGIEMEPNMPNVAGQDAIRKRYTDMMAGFDTDIQLKSEETVVNGDWAFDRGQFWLHVMSKDPKSTLPMVMDQGKYLVILRKQADGGWKISRAASSTSIAPPPQPAPGK